MHIRLYPFLLIVLILVSPTLVSSCENNISNDEQIPINPTSSIIQLSTPTATPTEVVAVDDDCIQLTEDSFTSDGELIVYSWGGGNLQLLNLKTIELSDNSYQYFKASPNGNQIAYLDYVNDTTVVTIISAESIMKFPVEEVSTINWVNNDTIAMIKISGYSGYTPIEQAQLLNLTTGKITIQNTDFPNFHPYFPEFMNLWDSMPIFDPNLGYAIYPAWLPDSYGINLINLDDESIVTSLEVSPYNFFSPHWSPDGSGFIIPFPYHGNNIALITTDGQETLLTDFDALNSTDLAWSPDGKKVAFWFSKEVWFSYDNVLNKIRRWNLAIIDLMDESTIVTCAGNEESLFLIPSSVWSPDGKFIAIGVKHDYFLPDSEIALVDLENFSYSFVENSENLSPYGWISFTPNMP